MTDVAAPDDLPRAASVRSRWPGLIWAIPLSALTLVSILGVHAFLNRGIGIIVSFDSVSGVKIGDTKVMYQGYEVGRVTKMDVDRPTHRINLSINLDRRAEPILRTGTLFWLVGVKPDLSDLSSVKGAIAGPTIGLAPSFEGKPTHYFRGLGQEPAVLPGTPGTSYQLIATQIGSIKPRSVIRYHGQEIGKVTATAFNGPNHFRIAIFVNRPYDLMVRSNTIFWMAPAVDLALGSGSLQARAIDPGALLNGAVDMDQMSKRGSVQSPPKTQFTLYDTRADAETDPPGPTIDYAMTFPDNGGNFVVGAPVTLMGFRIGTLTDRRLMLDGPGGLPSTKVIVSLDAARLTAQTFGAPAGGDRLRSTADAAVGRLLAHGYRAAMVQQPPLVGSYGIAFVRHQDGRASRLLPGSPPEVPTLPGGTDPGQQIGEILGKINRVPIERIGEDLAATMGRVRLLASSPKVDESLTHLRDALARVDAITAEAKPQIGPTLVKLREAATHASAAADAARSLLAGDGGNPDASLPAAIRELTDAAGSIRALADYLGRHPEALIEGKQPGKSKMRKAK